jgi:hypothetical protein
MLAWLYQHSFNAASPLQLNVTSITDRYSGKYSFTVLTNAESTVKNHGEVDVLDELGPGRPRGGGGDQVDRDLDAGGTSHVVEAAEMLRRNFKEAFAAFFSLSSHM